MQKFLLLLVVVLITSNAFIIPTNRLLKRNTIVIYSSEISNDNEALFEEMIELICGSYESVMAPMNQPDNQKIIKTSHYIKASSNNDFSKSHHQPGGMYAEKELADHFEDKFVTPDLHKPDQNPLTGMSAGQKLAMLLKDLNKLGLMEEVEKNIAARGMMNEHLIERFNSFLNKPGNDEGFSMGFLGVLMEEVNALLP